LFFLIASCGLVIPLSTYSPPFNLLLAWPSPLWAVNHHSDTTYMFGLSTFVILAAALGLECIVRGALRRRTPMLPIFLALSAASMAWFCGVIGLPGALASPLLGFFVAVVFLTAAALVSLQRAANGVRVRRAVYALLLLAAIDAATVAFWHVRSITWGETRDIDFSSFADGVGLRNQLLNAYPATILELRSAKRLADAKLYPGLLYMALYPAAARLDAVAGLPRPLRGSVEVTGISYNALELSIRSPEAALFFWRDSYFPFWRSWVDGGEVQVRSALGAFKAVPIPAGRASVRFEFQPRAFVWALALAASIVFGLAATLVALALRPAMASRR
jgi:hypothetical protein